MPDGDACWLIKVGQHGSGVAWARQTQDDARAAAGPIQSLIADGEVQRLGVAHMKVCNGPPPYVEHIHPVCAPNHTWLGHLREVNVEMVTGARGYDADRP